jgi:hypothetical protein
MRKGMADIQVQPNGGFPVPPASLGVRVVSVRHDACGSSTRMTLPELLPLGAVRRVVCGVCAQPFENPVVEESRRVLGLPIALPSLTLPDLHERAWRYLSVPLAAGAVIGALMVIQGSGDEPVTSASDVAAKPQVHAGTNNAAKAGEGRKASHVDTHNAHFVRGATFSVALPKGWQRTSTEAGASFAASAPKGAADATLWVERDPKLDLPSFEARSLEQLRQLAGSAHVVSTVAAPTADKWVVRLAADAPPNSPRYEVTLRASGPYRYYLATTLQPDAPAEAADGVDLIAGSFMPRGAK